MQQAADQAGADQLFEARAGFAEFEAAQDHRADLELLVHQRIEPDVAADEVAPAFGGGERDAVLAGQGLERLGLDEGDVADPGRPAGAPAPGPGALARPVVAVPLQPAAGHRAGPCYAEGGLPGARGEV